MDRTSNTKDSDRAPSSSSSLLGSSTAPVGRRVEMPVEVLHQRMSMSRSIRRSRNPMTLPGEDLQEVLAEQVREFRIHDRVAHTLVE